VVHKDRTDRSGPDTRTGLSNNPAIGSPASTRVAVGLNAAYTLSDGVEAYE
jgi:iron complex outermembrane receptor protein